MSEEKKAVEKRIRVLNAKLSIIDSTLIFKKRERKKKKRKIKK